ncbi:MAG: CapA family protein [Eubacterium sp.]|nr:CapA family protein [Eubacterium sp.]
MSRQDRPDQKKLMNVPGDGMDMPVEQNSEESNDDRTEASTEQNFEERNDSRKEVSGGQSSEEMSDVRKRIEARKAEGRRMRELRKSPEYLAKEAREQKLLRLTIAAAGVILVLIIVLLAKACGGKHRSSGLASVSAASADSAATSDSTGNSVTILAAGDNLIHEVIYTQYRTGSGYDFSPLYKDVKQEISAADIAYVNAETCMSGDVIPPAGYPSFSTPPEDADALIDAGFDIVNTGNNHTFDWGSSAVEAGQQVWNSRNIPTIGVYKGDEDLNQVRIIEKNGIKVAFVSFVEFSIADIPADSPYQMVFFSDEDKVKQTIENAKAQADIVVAAAHWGTEDTPDMNQTQADMAQKMVDWGADIIFGTHPHVVQQLVCLTRSSDGRRCPVLYSQGNFVSGMEARQNLVSGLFNVKAVRDPSSGQVYVESMEFTPTVTWYDDDRYDLHAMYASDLTDQLAADHGIKNWDEPLTVDYVKETLEKVIPEEYLNQYGSVQKGTFNGNGTEEGESVSSGSAAALVPVEE